MKPEDNIKFGSISGHALNSRDCLHAGRSNPFVPIDHAFSVSGRNK